MTAEEMIAFGRERTIEALRSLPSRLDFNFYNSNIRVTRSGGLEVGRYVRLKVRHLRPDGRRSILLNIIYKTLLPSELPPTAEDMKQAENALLAMATGTFVASTLPPPSSPPPAGIEQPAPPPEAPGGGALEPPPPPPPPPPPTIVTAASVAELAANLDFFLIQAGLPTDRTLIYGGYNITVMAPGTPEGELQLTQQFIARGILNPDGTRGPSAYGVRKLDIPGAVRDFYETYALP